MRKQGKKSLRVEFGMAKADEGDSEEATKQEEAIEGAMNGVVDADYATRFAFADMGVEGLKELAKVLEVKE